MGAILDKSDEGAVITFANGLDIENADEIRSCFIRALVNYDRISLVFAEIASIDLSCLQLLCSAHRSAVRMNKQILIAGPCPDILQQTIEDAGFSRRSGCRLGSAAGCFWCRTRR